MKILVAEDDRVTRGLLDRHLTKWGHEVLAYSDGIQAWGKLCSDDAPRLAILDWMMPGMDGVEICKKIREFGRKHYVYIILLTSKDSTDDVIEGLDAGADDYIKKPFDPNELKVRVRAGVRLVQLQGDLLSTLEMSEFRASHDPLTELWNRGAIMGILHKELDRSKRENRSAGVLMLDIDYFKRINDQHGHLAGDAVLRELAKRLNGAVRSYDSVGRYGGEEFLVVIPNVNGTEALQVAERLRQEVTGKPMRTSEGIFPVTLSVGVAVTDWIDGYDMDELTRIADQALYRAKENGRNRVEVGKAPSEELRWSVDTALSTLVIEA